jgi:hypothetical protein
LRRADAVVADLSAKGAGLSKTERITLKPGANFLRLPLAVASGSGAVSRRILGTTVIGGMLASTLLAIFLIPASFYVVEKFFAGRKEDALQDYLKTTLFFESSGAWYAEAVTKAGELLEEMGETAKANELRQKSTTKK